MVLRTETPAGSPVAAFEVVDLPEAMTARELIRLRAREDYSRTYPDAPRPDREQQADQAERAFLANGFFLLVGDRQVLGLDEVVWLDGTAEVVFLRLLPLVGG